MDLSLFGFESFTNPHHRLFLPFLLASFVIALVYVYFRPRYRAVLFSRAHWLHPSALADYGYFVLISIIKVLVIVPLIIGAKEVAITVIGALNSVAGYLPPLDAPRWAILLGFTVALFVVSDLTRYWLHRWMHESAWLWRFHRIHHGARVLNPLTFYRVHPVENLLFGLRYALTAGTVTGLFIYLFGARLGLYEVLGVNVIVFAFDALGSNLRHSHIPLRYGDTMERWLISPFMHQIHHTREGLRTNYGGTLAVWDRLFGTLRIEASRPLRFGIADASHNILKMLIEPFAIGKSDGRLRMENDDRNAI